jgi:hypothetical protein
MASIFTSTSRVGDCFFSALTLVALCMSAQAQSDKEKDASTKPKCGVAKPMGDTYAAAKSVASEQTRLVLYRAPIDTDTPADKLGVVSVYSITFKRNFKRLWALS